MSSSEDDVTFRSPERVLRTPVSSPEIDDAALQSLLDQLNNVRGIIDDEVARVGVLDFDSSFELLEGEDSDFRTPLTNFQVPSIPQPRQQHHVSPPQSLLSGRISQSTSNLSTSGFLSQLPLFVRRPSISLQNSPERPVGSFVATPLPLGNMSIHSDEGHGGGGAPDDNGRPPNPLWAEVDYEFDIFSTMVTKETDVIIPAMAQNTVTVDELEGYVADINTLLNRDLVKLKNQCDEAKREENVPREDHIKMKTDLWNIEKQLEKVKRDLTKGITALTPAATTTPAATVTSDSVALLSAMGRAHATAPRVELPTFDGTISEFASFQKKFKFIVTLLHTKKELYATHLEGSLLGEAARYVGSKGNWFDKYDELWELLEDRYANRWILASDTIRGFFGKPTPEPTQEAVDTWFYSQMDAMQSVIDLNFSVEQLMVNIVTQSLPEEFGNVLRNGLRALQPGKKQAAFSQSEIRTVYNDTIAIRGTGLITSPITGTLNFSTGVYRSDNSNNKGAYGNHYNRGYVQNGGYYQKNSSDANNGNYYQKTSSDARQDGASGDRRDGYYKKGNQGNYNENWRAQQQSRQQKAKAKRPRICYFCDSCDHASFLCDVLPSPKERRQKLRSLGKCIACCQPKHTDECRGNLKCSYHPSQKHYGWLCGGYADPHPGKHDS